MSPPTLQSRARGMILGAALGDALGRPVEFSTWEAIRDRYGADGLQEPEGPLRPTDDTSMTVAVARALIDAGADGPEALMAAIVREFVHWRSIVRPDDAPGTTCLEATARLAAGVGWDRAGVSWSKGNGAAMRAAPVGFFFARHPLLLREVSRLIARSTHGHPTAASSAVAVATCVREALAARAPRHWVDAAIAAMTNLPGGEVVDALARVPAALRHGAEPPRMEAVGEGWTADEAVALALVAVLRHPSDFVGAMRCAVNHSGDSDTVACIAGALLGARLGEDELPEEWLDRLEGAEALVEVADRLAAATQTLR